MEYRWATGHTISYRRWRPTGQPTRCSDHPDRRCSARLAAKAATSTVHCRRTGATPSNIASSTSLADRSEYHRRNLSLTALAMANETSGDPARARARFGRARHPVKPANAKPQPKANAQRPAPIGREVARTESEHRARDRCGPSRPSPAGGPRALTSAPTPFSTASRYQLVGLTARHPIPPFTSIRSFVIAGWFDRAPMAQLSPRRYACGTTPAECLEGENPITCRSCSRPSSS